MVLTCMTEPAFLCRDGQIILANPAARQIGISEQSDPERDFAAPAQNQPVMQFSHSYAGHEWTVQSCLLDEGRLFVLRRVGETVSTHALASAAKALRESLQILFSAAKKLSDQLTDRDDEKTQNSIGILNRAMFQIERTTGHLTDAALLRSVSKKRSVDCVHFFRHMAELLQSYIGSTGRRFEFQCPDRSFNVTMDANAVERAVLNLISNAIANTPEGGLITLSVKPVGRLCHVCVKNEGSVLTAADLSGLLNRYETADIMHGAGFGLSVVRSVACRHGGTVLTEPNPDGGLCVLFTLKRDNAKHGSSTLETPIVVDGGHNPYLIELSDVLDYTEYKPDTIMETRIR